MADAPKQPAEVIRENRYDRNRRDRDIALGGEGGREQERRRRRSAVRLGFRLENHGYDGGNKKEKHQDEIFLARLPGGAAVIEAIRGFQSMMVPEVVGLRIE